MTDYRAPIVLIVTLLLVTLMPRSLPAREIPTFTLGSMGGDFTGGTMLFTGDMMLGRHVETLIGREGDDYPFLGIASLVQSVDFAFSNFEASIPATHVQTEDGAFNFSVDSSFLHQVKEVGFDGFSFANNHAFDNGTDGYQESIATCTNIGFLCSGHPYEVSSSSSSAVIPIGDLTVGVLFLNVVEVEISFDSVSDLLRELKDKTDEQFVYIHWGKEYELEHTDLQENLAKFLIDNGVDAIFGHHPHVVQDIQVYNGKPIFYSLGNLIFDQYFSDEVQVGYAVKLHIEKESIIYTIIPYNSIKTRSQPHLLGGTEKNIFFETLSIAGFTSSEVLQGSTITAPRSYNSDLLKLHYPL